MVIYFNAMTITHQVCVMELKQVHCFIAQRLLTANRPRQVHVIFIWAHCPYRAASAFISCILTARITAIKLFFPKTIISNSDWCNFTICSQCWTCRLIAVSCFYDSIQTNIHTNKPSKVVSDWIKQCFDFSFFSQHCYCSAMSALNVSNVLLGMNVIKKCMSGGIAYRDLLSGEIKSHLLHIVCTIRWLKWQTESF